MDARRRQRDAGSGRRDRRAAVARRPEVGRRRSRCSPSRVMPGPQLTAAVEACRTVRAPAAACADRLGRLLPDSARRYGARLADRGLRRPIAGRAGAARADRGAAHVQHSELRIREFRIAVPWPVVEDANGRVVHNPTGPMTPLDELPDLPYARVDMERYIQPTYLGRRTVAHNSSFGCPFSCSFCAVVAMTNRRWLAQSPARMDAGRAPPGRDLSRGCGADARHGLLHLRGARRGVRRADHAARHQLVGPRPRRHAHAVLGRDVAGDGAVRPEDGVLGRRVGLGRDARGDEQGRQGRRPS